MTKLLQLREWLTLPEAAKHLSTILQDDVTEPDILRLALDDQITLSVNFVNHARGRLGKTIPLLQAECMVFKQGKTIPTLIERAKFGELSLKAQNKLVQDRYFLMFSGGIAKDCESAYKFDETIEDIKGVWDLAMVGSERIDAEHRFQQLTGGPAVSLVCFGGPVVNQGNTFCNICTIIDDKRKYDDPDNWSPAARLPDDSVFVIRSKVLTEFIESLQHESKETESYRPKQDVQEGVILDTLKDMEFDPQALPTTKGSAGPKSKVRKVLELDRRLFTPSTFDKTWQRLRDLGRIKDTES